MSGINVLLRHLFSCNTSAVSGKVMTSHKHFACTKRLEVSTVDYVLEDVDDDMTIEAFVFKDIKGYFIKLEGKPFMHYKQSERGNTSRSSEYIETAIKYVSKISDPDKAIDLLVLVVYEYLYNSKSDSNLATMDVLEFQLSYMFDTSIGTSNPEISKGLCITDARRILSSISDKMFEIDRHNILHINIDCLYGKTEEFHRFRSLIFSRLATVD